MIYGGEEKRDAILILLNDISELMDSDCMYSITDTKNFIGYKAGKSIDIKVKIGAQVPEKSPLHQAFIEKRSVTKIVPKDVWGVPFRSTATPIVDNLGAVVGCVGIGISIEKEMQLIETHRKFVSKFETLSTQANEVSSGISKLSSDNMDSLDIAKLIIANAAKTDSILKEINAISSITNMLAINASIEASHAGVHGKGFAVVASELKKFSGSIKSNLTNIYLILEDIQKSVNSLSKTTSNNALLIESEVEIMKSLSKTISSMKEVSEQYSELL